MSKRYPGGIIRKTPQTPSQTSAQGIWDMASVTQAVKENTWPIAGVPDPISKSLRFRSSASANLSRTNTATGDRQKFTWSAWIKRGAISSASDQWLFCSDNYNTSSNAFIFAVILKLGGGVEADKLVVGLENSVGGGTDGKRETTQVFRDPSAWYHFVAAIDTTQSTANNRMRVYVNGSEITAFSTSTNPTQNSNVDINKSGGTPRVGCFLLNNSNARFFDGYMTEVYLIDGQALTPSSFGNTNDQTGVWQPIAYTGTYGTNGFYLPFSNTASTTTLGYDFSGNSNNWTPNNISLTSGSTYDSMVDVPTQWIPYNTAGDTGALFRGNYATLNPINGATATVVPSNGNLTCTWGGSQGNASIGSTLSVSSGKWYFEATLATVGGSFPFVGIIPTQSVVNSSTSEAGYTNNNWVGNGTLSAGDVVGIAFDLDTLTFNAYKNGTAITVASGGKSSDTIVSGVASWMPTISGLAGTVWNMNFGQRPFSYTPPTGFKTLCTTNLSTPTIGATAATQASKYMNIVLYTGDNSSSPRSITGFGFSPDFVWVKARSNTIDHNLWNSVMGAGASQGLHSNTNAAAGDSGNFAIYGYVSSLDSDGFTVTKGSDATYGNFWHNYTSTTYVAWAWDANGSGSSNTDGSITSTVSVNTTAGFSIITFTGNGSAGATIGHGLGVAPELLIFKGRNTGTDGLTWFRAYNTNQGQMQLDSTAGIYNPGNGLYFNSTYPSSSVITLGTSGSTNGSTQTYVVYAFAPIAGYSAFGSYTGNGSDDGPFTYTGFRPRYVMIKRTDSTGNWIMFDSARGTYNVNGPYVYANSSAAEATSSSVGLDFLSNGFKNRNTYNDSNTSSATYVYMAFAESPFKYALAR